MVCLLESTHLVTHSTHVHTAHVHSSHLSTHLSAHVHTAHSHSGLSHGESLHSESREHQVHVLGDINRLVSEVLVTLLFLGISLSVLLLQLGNSGGQISHALDHEWHSKVHVSESPGEFHDHIWLQQFVAGEATGREAFLVSDLNKESEQLLSKSRIFTLQGGLHGVLVKFFLLGKGNRLLVSLVLSVQEGGDSSELQQLVFLQSLGKGDLVEVVIFMNGNSQGFVILILNQDFIDGVINRAQIVMLDTLQEWKHQSDVSGLLHHMDDLGVVNLSAQNLQQIVQQHWLLIQVELDSSVVQVVVGDLLDVSNKDLVLPANWRVLHHGEDGVIVLIIMDVQENGLRPHLVSLASSEQFWNVNLSVVTSAVIHQFLWLVLSVENTQLGEHTDVRSLKTETVLNEVGQFFPVAILLVVGNNILQMIRMHNNVWTSNTSQSELLSLHTSEGDLLPGLWSVSLLGSLEGSLELSQMDQARGQLGVVSETFEQDLSSLVVLLLEASVTNISDISRVGGGDESLQLIQFVALGQRVDQFAVNKLILYLSSAHLKVADQILEFLLSFGGLDHSLIEIGVISLNVRLNGLANQVLVQLSSGQLAPDLWEVHLLGELLGSVNGFDVVQQNLDGLNIVVGLLVDNEGLLVQLVVASEGDLSQFRTIIVVQSVNVIHNSGGISLDGGQDQQVLQVLVVAEIGVVGVKNDLLQQLNQFVWQFSGHESLHSGGNLLRVLGLWKGGGHNLVNNWSSVLVILSQDQSPQFFTLSLNQISGLQSVETVLVGDLNQLSVTTSPSSLVGSVSEMRVSVLAVFTNNLTVIELVIDQEIVRVLVNINVDFGQGVVQSSDLVSFSSSSFEPLLEDSELVSLLNLINQLIDWAVTSEVVQDLLDVGLITVEIQQTAKHLWGGSWVHLKEVHLDEFAHVVLVQVLGQFTNVTVLVTQEDEWSWIWQFLLLEVILNLLGVIVVGLLDDSLNFLHLVQFAGGVNVFEVDLMVFGGAQDSTQEVEQTVEATVALVHLDQCWDGDLGVVFDGGLDNHLDGTSVVLHDFVKALEGSLWVLGSQELDHLLRLDTLWTNVHDNSLDILGISVVLESELEQTGLLAQLGDSGLIEVGEHVHFQDGLSHRRGSHQVQLQQSGLEMSFLSSVTFQDLQQELGGFHQFALGHEDINNTSNVNLRLFATLSVAESLGKSQSTLRVGQDDALQQVHPVWRVSNLVGVWLDLIELLGLDETFNNLGGGVGFQMDGQSQVGVNSLDNISKFFGALQLVLVQPVLKQILVSLLQHWLGQFDGLDSVQLTLLQESLEVHQDWLSLSLLLWQLLELVDGIHSSESLAGVGGNLGSSLVVSLGQQGVELLGEQFTSTSKTVSSAQFHGDFGRVTQMSALGGDVRNQVISININTKNLSLSVDTNNTVSLGVSGGHKHGVVTNSVSENQTAAGDLKQEQITKLRDHEHHTVLLAELHADWEISWVVRGVRNIARFLEFGSTLWWSTNFHDVELRGALASLSFSEAEQARLLAAIMNNSLSEATSMTLQELLLVGLSEVQLHVSIDGLSTVRGVNGGQKHPFLATIHGESDNLAIVRGSQSTRSIENLLWGVISTGESVASVSTDHTNGITVQPFPENNWLSQISINELLLSIQVKDLDVMSTTALILGLEGDDILGRMHHEVLSLQWSSGSLEIVGNINHDHLRSSITVLVLDGDIAVTLEVGVTKSKKVLLHIQVSELLQLKESNRK